jgi:precorrin-2 dehydrogenase/sirohydrochlorin ferrochelatase
VRGEKSAKSVKGAKSLKGEKGVKYYPVFLDVRGARCVVVGGGPVAARKAKALAEAGAQVVAVAPAFAVEFESLPNVQRLTAPYNATVPAGARVVVAATDDPSVNAAVSRDARAAGVLVNVVDQPELGDFIAPATVDRGDLVVAVSTGGASPALAARLRRELEAAYPADYAAFTDLLRTMRAEVQATVADAVRRRALLTQLAEPAFFALFAAEGREQTIERMRRLVAAG